MSIYFDSTRDEIMAQDAQDAWLRSLHAGEFPAPEPAISVADLFTEGDQVRDRVGRTGVVRNIVVDSMGARAVVLVDSVLPYQAEFSLDANRSGWELVGEGGF